MRSIGCKRSLAAAMAALLLPAWATAQKGWPRGGAAANDSIQGSPLLADLDGDGRLEIAVAGFDDYLYVYNHDGTPRTGFPVQLGFADGSIASVTALNQTGSGALSLALLGDNSSSKAAAIKIVSASGGTPTTVTLASNADASGKATLCAVDCRKYLGGSLHPAEELVVRDGLGQVHILHRLTDGTYSDLFTAEAANFSTAATQQQQDLSGSQPLAASVSAAALPDGKTLLVAPSTDGKVYYWEITSTAATPWSVTPIASLETGETTRFYASATLTDLDGDGGLEIVAAATNGKVYVWEYLNGKVLRTGWPADTDQVIFSSPAVANIDAGPTKEVVVGSDNGKVFAFNASGGTLSGWPVQTRGAVFASPMLADIDPSAGVEVIVGGTDSYIYAWNVSGAALAGWPKLLGTPVYASPAVGDIHKSLKYSVIFAGFDGRVFCFDIYHRYDPQLPGWFQFRGGPSRRGGLQ